MMKLHKTYKTFPINSKWRNRAEPPLSSISSNENITFIIAIGHTTSPNVPTVLGKQCCQVSHKVPGNLPTQWFDFQGCWQWAMKALLWQNSHWGVTLLNCVTSQHSGSILRNTTAMALDDKKCVSLEKQTQEGLLRQASPNCCTASNYIIESNYFIVLNHFLQQLRS